MENSVQASSELTIGSLKSTMVKVPGSNDQIDSGAGAGRVLFMSAEGARKVSSI